MRDGNNLVKNIPYSEHAVKYAYCYISWLGGSRGGKLWVWVKTEVEELIQHSPQHCQSPGREIIRTPEICSSDSRTLKGQGLRKRNPFIGAEVDDRKNPIDVETVEEIQLSSIPSASHNCFMHLQGVLRGS